MLLYSLMLVFCDAAFVDCEVKVACLQGRLAFGTQLNDLPSLAMCRQVPISLNENVCI